MTWFQAIFLGLVQGLTEFLPVSSSAHLVLTPYLLDWDIAPEYIFPFDVLVQLGTLIAVILYFRKDIWQVSAAFLKGIWHRQPFNDPAARMGWYLILATIPASVVGLLITRTVEETFQSPTVTAGFLLLTAMLLFVAGKLTQPVRDISDLTWLDALWFGLAQVLALFPGVSRSGSTISAGMFRQFNRSSAARFSFLMSIPVMLGAGLLSILELGDMKNLTTFIPLLLIGIVTAAVVGYLSIHWLLNYLNRRSLNIFGAYCVVLGISVFIVSYAR